jgi:hypothetical protein
MTDQVHQACRDGNACVLIRLVIQGHNLRAKNDKGESPYHVAYRLHHRECCSVLEEAGVKHHGPDGIDYAKLSTLRGNEWLLSLHYPLFYVVEKGWTKELLKLIQLGCNLGEINVIRETAFERAVRFSSWDCARILMWQGVDECIACDPEAKTIASRHLDSSGFGADLRREIEDFLVVPSF